MSELLGQTFADLTAVLAFASFLALVNERLNELFIKDGLRLVFKRFGDGVDPAPYAALVTGTVISIMFRVDLLSSVVEQVGIADVPTWAGIVLTGFIVGGGSNFLHDLWPQGKRQW